MPASVSAQTPPTEPATVPAPADEAPQASPPPASARGIEEIIVTAERREQNLHDVAQTITAFTPEDLQAANLRDAYDLQLKVPGLVATGGLPAITLRGLGQDSDVLGPGIDPGFQLHINDIYVAQLAVALLGFVDIENISVLPGPQGTGYGRNSTGGSMNITTKRPLLEEWEISGEVSAAQWGNVRITTVANAPLIPGELAGRIAYRREFPSNYYDVTGQNGHKQHLTNNALTGGHYVRTSLRWAPTEDVTADFIASYSLDKDDGGTPRPLGPYPTFNPGQSTIFFGGVNPTGATPNSDDASEIRSNREQDQRYETVWAQAIVEWALASHVIKLNGNYQYWDYAIDRDQDFTDNDAQRLVLLDTHNTWSGEATIRSDYADSKINWLFGANYQDDSAPDTDVPVWNYQAAAELENFAVFDAFDPSMMLSADTANTRLVCGGVPCLFTPGDPDRPFARFRANTDTQTAGVFLEGGVDLTEKFRFEAGVRYSWTRRHMRDTGHLDILLETYDLITDVASGGTQNFCTDVVGLPEIFFGTDTRPKENCFNYFIYPSLQAQTPVPLDADNIAFLVPLRGNRDRDTLNATAIVKKKEWDSVTGRARLEFRPLDGQLFYVSYSRGERHGGFNFFVDDPFKSETINAYELGAKNSLFDNQLFLATTFFYYDFENRFINETQFNVTTTVNAPESTIYGIELQWEWAATEALRISGNAGWLHAEITGDFFSQDNTGSIANPNGFCPGKVYPNTPGSDFAGLPAIGDLHGDGPTCDGALLENLNGNVFPRSPEFTLSLGAEYRFELASGALTPRLDFAYRDAVFYRQFENPLDRQAAYTRTDARLRYDLAAKPFWFEAYVQNLEDNQKIKTQVEVPDNWLRNYWLAPPRTFGVRVGWKMTGGSVGDLWPF
jgi:iron complex outermembrane receptor protein